MSTDFSEWLIAHDNSPYASLQVGTVSPDEDFSTWFVSNGGYLHPSLELASSAEDGHYLRVKHDQSLAAGDTIVSCPHDLTLSWPSTHKYHFKDIQSDFTPHLSTRLFLMKQYLLKAYSPWWPYIRLLPQPYDQDSFQTPMYYSTQDMLWIKGTNLEHARDVREEAWRKEFDDVFKMLFANSDEIEQSRLWTWQLYLWACTVMTSRSFPGPAAFNRDEHNYPIHNDVDGRSPVLIPGLDFLNHNPTSRVAWLWDFRMCTIKTDMAITAGSQVPNNYGPKSNGELIMGYGFSLPNNPSDHFTIGFSPAISTYVKKVKARRRLPNLIGPDNKCHDGTENSIDAFDSIEHSADESGYSSESADILVTGSSVERDIHCVGLSKDGYTFSPNFLRDLSIAVESPRERRENEGLSSFRDHHFTNQHFWDAHISRNKLHVMCAVIMILQKGRLGIRQHDEDIPGQERSAKQMDASRYRKSQLKILDLVLESLQETLISYTAGTHKDEPLSHLSRRTVRLEDTLKELPESLLKDYRNVLYAGLKTRDPVKMRKRGGADFAFTAWLLGLLVFNKYESEAIQNGISTGSAFKGRLYIWIQFLEKHYPANEVDGTNPNAQEAGESPWFDPVRGSAENSEDDPSATVVSYLRAIQSAVSKHPTSIYNDPEISLKSLQWCLQVVRMEGVWYPNLEDGREEDQWLLFLDTG